MASALDTDSLHVFEDVHELQIDVVRVREIHLEVARVRKARKRGDYE